jgi:hypothetical protein
MQEQERNMQEPIHACAVRGDMLVLGVTSTGGSNAEDFRLDAVNESAGYILTIVRTRPDLLRAAAHVKEVQLPLSAVLEGQSFTVRNPFTAGPHSNSKVWLIDPFK